MALLSRKRDSVACMIDDRFIRFFHVAQNGKKVSLKKYFSERIPDDLFDKHHMIIPDQTMIDRLTEIRKKHELKHVHLVVPDRYVTVFHTTIPHTVFERNKKSFQINLESYLENLLDQHPEFSAIDMIADYDLIERDDEGYHVHVAVARPELFHHIPELFESAGFVIDHIDISSFAIHRVAKHMHHKQGYGVISIGTDTTSISAVKSGNIIASTIVPVGSNDLLQTLQRVLEISHQEAQSIIQQYGILHTHPDKQVLGELFVTLKPIVEGISFVGHMCSQKLYQHTFYHQAPETMYLYGIGASIAGVAQYLGIKTDTTIRPIDVIPTEFIDEEILLQVPVELVPLYLPVMSTAIHYLTE